MIYLAEYDGPEGGLCQGVVHFPAAARLAAWCPPRWFTIAARLAGARAAVPGVQAAVRLHLQAGQLNAALIFTAPAESAPALRHFLAGFLQLLALVPDSVRIPQEQSAHNAAVECRSQFLCRAGDGAALHGEPWMVVPFRVWPGLAGIFEQATALGHEVFYQANLHATARSPALESTARKNLVAIEHGKPIPPGLLSVQRAAMSALAGPVVLVDEYLGTRTATAARWAATALGELFAEHAAGLRVPPPPFAFEENRLAVFGKADTEFSELTALGAHQSLIRELAPWDFAAQALPAASAHGFFEWSGSLARWFEPPLAAQRDAGRVVFDAMEKGQQAEAEAAAQTAAATAQWRLSEQPGAYSFISYRRPDFPIIEPVLGGIQSAGVPFWFDRGIPGAADWLDVLQQRIHACRNVIFFLSRSAAESRYVQMEIRYAHALGKRLIPVGIEALDPHSLPGGLGMVLGPIQLVKPGVADLLSALSAGLK